MEQKTEDHSVKQNKITLKNAKIATRALHVGQEASQWASKAVVPPIVMASTYKQSAPAVHSGFYYGRSTNPTRKSLETCLASLEDAEHALVFASGLAAMSAVIQLLSAGDHIIGGNELYGGSSRLLDTIATRAGLRVTYVDMSDLAAISTAVANKSNAKQQLLWFETPTNPLLKVVDIVEVVKVAKEADPNIITAVDNTFLSPYLQRPVALGADISMSSVSKYLNGHSDVIMGALATRDPSLYEKLSFIQKAAGAVPSPFDCYLVNRGLKTLSVRMEAHCDNALKVATFLRDHPFVKKVIYPGLEDHPQREIVKKQVDGGAGGGMVSVVISGDRGAFLGHLTLFTLAESLGGVESLVSVPALMSHASVSAEKRAALGIDDGLIRLSVGLEAAEDLIADLDGALKAANQ